eukprot:2075614-Alexandrium_andersonii.AAC.1
MGSLPFHWTTSRSRRSPRWAGPRPRSRRSRSRRPGRGAPRAAPSSTSAASGCRAGGGPWSGLVVNAEQP